MKLDLTSLNLLDKWIVEHGAAAIMGVHIELLRDQLAALDRETTNLKTQVADLQAAHKNLTEECQHRAARIYELQVAAQKDQQERRSDEEHKLMLMLTEGRRRTARELAREMGYGLDATEVILNGLADEGVELIGKQDFYRMEFEPGRDSEWYLANKGKAYLRRKKLIR